MTVDLNNLESCSVAELVALVNQLLQRVERVEALEAENTSLKEQLRASKRATAPFSKGKPNPAPEGLGRRAGEGRFERQAIPVGCCGCRQCPAGVAGLSAMRVAAGSGGTNRISRRTKRGAQTYESMKSVTATLALRGHSVASALADLIQDRPMPLALAR